MLADSRVLIVGLGGLGSPAAFYLAGAGIGELHLVDADRVEMSNLHRQIIHTHDRLGQHKVRSAQVQLNALNPQVRVDTSVENITAENAATWVKQADCVIDASDNFLTRYVVNETCVAHNVPLVSGAAIRYEGQLMSVLPKKSACYQCVFPQAAGASNQDSCENSGVLGPVPGTIGSLQALEAIKILAGIGQPLHNRLLTFNASSLEFRILKTRRDPHCRVCGGTTS